MLKNLAIVQARMGSSRLPGKVLKNINKTPAISLLLQRLSRSKLIDKIVVATGNTQENDELEKFVKSQGFDVFRGDERDVLNRYYDCSKFYKAKNIIRITGDCPFIDPSIVDQVIGLFLDTKVSYCSNTNPPTYPDGLDVEIFTFKALEKAAKKACSPFEREHVTPFIINDNKESNQNLAYQEDYSGLRLTLDHDSDLRLMNSVVDNLKNKDHFSFDDILQLHTSKPEVFSIKNNWTRNQFMSANSGSKLYLRAKEIIPGGNMLLSKRPEMFLPEKWPAYFSKAKDINVYDLDNNKYIDMTIMGVGTNTLGYANSEVDESVINSLKGGNLSTLNCKEEVLLAEKLIELHPWFDMVRFARSGGEANAIAIRIARAASGRDNVAICGYHGWHDWYLSSNLKDSNNLNEHLLEGLETNGVPKALQGTTFPFKYNDLDYLERLITEKNIGVIKMEVFRNITPKNGFLEAVRDLSNKHNIVLVFDECSSGFRETYGGLHKKFNVLPDMAMFGKTLGNGYAITSIIGKRAVMEAAQTSFISSTFWTERIGPTAALKTLEIMKRLNSWDVITESGNYFREHLTKLSKKYNLDIQVSGLPALTSYSFKKNNLLRKTYLTQEMLKKGYLSSNAFFPSILHTHEVLDKYFDTIEPFMEKISDSSEEELFELLESPQCHDGFQRLN